MKKLLLLLGLASSLASAECYIRSETNLTKQAVSSVPVDIQRMITPERGGSRCVVRYRVLVRGEWATVEGIADGPTENSACASALDARRGYLLEEPEAGTVRADQAMVCSDLPDIRVHPVHVGEVIWESETDMHRHPDERKYFNYKDTQCRMFTERNARNGNFYTYQGIISRVNSKPNSKWVVVDKY